MSIVYWNIWYLSCVYVIEFSDGIVWSICFLFLLIKIDLFLYESDNCFLGESFEGIIIYLV